MSPAARALGETDSREASDRLIRELIDGGSDIRPEAAEALGRLGHAGSIDALVEALEDPDPRVKISAIGGLGAIGGDEVQELLFWYFGDRFDALTFPTLVDALSHMGDRRITVKGLEVVRVDVDRNILMVKGGVPGAPNSLLQIRRAGS